VAGEHRAHDLALRADAAAVDQPDLAQPRLGGLIEVGLGDRADLARRERVQIDRVFERELDRGVLVAQFRSSIGSPGSGVTPTSVKRYFS
jgi:hypothetical protein